MVRNKPAYCYESGCPLASKGQGFCLGSGDPATAEIAIVLETPSREDINFDLTSAPASDFLPEPRAEIERRRKAYPELSYDQVRQGAPAVGRAGALLQQWVLSHLGLKRSKLFLDLTLRCMPPKLKSGQYPTGDERKAAELACRHYDRIAEFRPDIAVVTLGPNSIMAEVTPLPLLVKDFERARDYAAQGLRPLVLVGGKAVEGFLRFGKNVTRSRGTYAWLPSSWIETYKNLFEFRKKERKARAPKEKKVTNLIGEVLGIAAPKKRNLPQLGPPHGGQE